jgi:hypothetical protein
MSDDFISGIAVALAIVGIAFVIRWLYLLAYRRFFEPWHGWREFEQYVISEEKKSLSELRNICEPLGWTISYNENPDAVIVNASGTEYQFSCVRSARDWAKGFGLTSL